ncbi:hypothetical protein N7931_15075 [Catenovulum sp. 2E275]|uniref:hypothetical protein n=1 Tax=Catenovulum sp. 2E275 TaxID=2980497 RepID=UPI0021CE412B|nr:hypothetical protein [Catenovulum sp. 2E275]MCU4676955.1 hypothetical protein [Catenovulum sp. 2E275]
MDETFRQNSINLVISTLAILCSYFLDLGGGLFWFGGLLIIPAIAFLFQFKFACGPYLLRLSIAILPWLVLCIIGLLWASKTEHDGQRTMNMFFFEMPLYSVAAGSVLVTIWFLIQKARTPS